MKNRDLLQEYKSKLRSSRYAPNTVNTYLYCVKPFLEAFETKDLSKISETEVAQFISRFGSENQISESYDRHMRTAIKKLFLLEFDNDIELRSLSKNNFNRISPPHIGNREIKKMIRSSHNYKHQCVIGILYSAGLRVKELINLKCSDIDFTTQQIHVKPRKAKKQRSLPLSPFLVPYLKNYRGSYSNQRPVFEGYKHKPLCPRAVQVIVGNAARLADVKRDVTPTMLRNSFAIHYLQSGTRPEIVQKMLGLESEQSMDKYITVATRQAVKIKTLLD